MRDESSNSGWALAMAVHVFTASGALFAFVALIAAMEGDLRGMFTWLAAALAVDGVDGTLARAVGVDRHAPRWDGAILDFVIDFLTYVLVPLAAVWRAGLLPDGVSVWACGLITMASAIYFADRSMKLDGHWFRGFPALWNVLILYLFAFPMAEWANLVVMIAAAVLMYAPFRFVHPLRVRRLRILTLIITGVWFLSAAVLVRDGFGSSIWPRAGLVIAGLYFLLLPLARRANPYGAREIDD